PRSSPPLWRSQPERQIRGAQPSDEQASGRRQACRGNDEDRTRTSRGTVSVVPRPKGSPVGGLVHYEPGVSFHTASKPPRTTSQKERLGRPTGRMAERRIVVRA